MPTAYLLISNNEHSSSYIKGVYLCEDYCKISLAELKNDELSNIDKDTSFIQEFEIDEYVLNSAFEAYLMGFIVQFGFECVGEMRTDYGTYFDRIDSVVNFIPNPSKDYELAPLLIEPDTLRMYDIKNSNSKNVETFVGVALWYEVYSSYIALASTDKSIVEEHMLKWENSEHRCGNDAEFKIQSINLREDMIQKAKNALKAGLLIEISCGFEEDEPIGDREYGLIKNILGFWLEDDYDLNVECRLIF